MTCTEMKIINIMMLISALIPIISGNMYLYIIPSILLIFELVIIYLDVKGIYELKLDRRRNK